MASGSPVITKCLNMVLRCRCARARGGGRVTAVTVGIHICNKDNSAKQLDLYSALEI